MSRGQALPRLTSLRVFAAASVVVFHLHAWEVTPMPASVASLGYLGVCFFFVLSGFVLAWGTEPGLPARTFYRRRFARVWPSHSVMLAAAATLPVVAVGRGWSEAVPNAVLVQSWAFDSTIAYGMNGVSWSLSCEAFFYASCPLLFQMFGRIERRWQWLLAAAALTFSLAVGVIAPGGAFHLPAARYGEFLVGVVAGLAMRAGWRPRVPVSVAIAAVVLGLALSSLLPFPLPNVLMVGPFLLVLLSAAARDLKGTPGWLWSRPLIFAGEASFALYLVHELVILNLQPYLATNAAFEVLVMVVVMCSSAVALHIGVERPFHRLLRGGRKSVALARPLGLLGRAPAQVAATEVRQ
jgi:peptidoglycan/LPS O-acetylase OafA/YrhL